MTPDEAKAKVALDNLIKKSRVHLYKPIQIAEILYRDRVYQDIDLLDLESYRNKSKKWRDEICLPLLGRVCTSSAKFQDNLFDENAIPPKVLSTLGKMNKSNPACVEKYIYQRFMNKHEQLSDALGYCLSSNKEDFDVKKFIDSFWNEPGLKRSLDKIYEIVVFALFDTLVDALDINVEVSVSEKSLPILTEFEDFSKKVMCINTQQMAHVLDGRVYRVGVTNAADRGLDMYSNWGPAIQIKHLSLSEELAENIVEGIASDKVIIVCKDVEKNIIVSLLTQIGWRNHIQSVVTETDLINWYEKALRGAFAEQLGNALLGTLCEEIAMEFPSVDETPDILRERNYQSFVDATWR